MATKAYFENIQSVLLENLRAAKKSLYIAVAWITDKDIVRVLAQKASEGVRVQVLITDDETNSQTDFSALEEAKGSIWRVGKQQEGQSTLMHNKFCVIDSHMVITGSYNWTWKAQKHFENITITDEDPTLAAQFIAEFEKIRLSVPSKDLPIAVDRQAILQRLEMVKNALLLQDAEDIYYQCLKLKKALLLVMPNDLVKAERITNLLTENNYNEAATLIEEILAVKAKQAGLSEESAVTLVSNLAVSKIQVREMRKSKKSQQMDEEEDADISFK